MLTVLEMLIILVNIPVLLGPLLPIKRIPRFLDFMPLASVIFLILHLFIDKDSVKFRFIPLYIFTIIMFLFTIKRIFKHNPNEPQRKVLTIVGRIFGLLALTISVLIPTVIIPFYSLPEPTGEFNVGTVVSSFVDENRIETFSQEAGSKREITVQFWYPSDRDSEKVDYDIEGAPISTAEESYPLLIFSHGAFGIRLSNTSTFRELASHGYIVASIDHTYHSFYTSFPDGRGVIANSNFINEAVGASGGDLSPERQFQVTHEWMDLRTSDVKFLIDSLKTGDIGTTEELLNNHMDLTRIGLFGHSLGGATAAQVARERDDVKAAIVMDGTMIGDIVGLNNGTEIITDESFTKPIMIMYSSLFEDQKARETSYLPNINAFNNAKDEAYSLYIKNSGHLNFTDLPRISPFFSKQLGIGTIDSLKCIEIVNDYSLAFFDKHIKGESASLLDGNEKYDEVEMEKGISNTR